MRSWASRTAEGDQSTPTRFAPVARASHRPGPPRPQARSTTVSPGSSLVSDTSRPSTHLVVPAVRLYVGGVFPAVRLGG